MLTEPERIELIRQAEKSNLSDEQMEALLEWAGNVIMSYELLEEVFDHKINIVAMDDEPLFSLGPNGTMGIDEAWIVNELDSTDLQDTDI